MEYTLPRAQLMRSAARSGGDSDIIPIARL